MWGANIFDCEGSRMDATRMLCQAFLIDFIFACLNNVPSFFIFFALQHFAGFFLLIVRLLIFHLASTIACHAATLA